MTISVAERLLGQAKVLVDKGFRVFPLEIDKKTPAHPAWQEHATTNPEIVEAMWRDPLGEVVPYNIGIATGNGITVLDVDVKKGKNGLQALDDLVSFYDLDDQTFTVRTASGGFHLYYNSQNLSLRNSASRVGEGLDVRSEGGYVVGPGSSINGEFYSIEKDLQVKNIAIWFANLCGEKPRKERPTSSETSLPIDLDTPEAIKRAISWLETDAPEAVSGSGGDAATYFAACGVKDFGISEIECLSLLLEHYNPAKCSPPWDDKELEQKVANAYRYGNMPIGAFNAAAEFDLEVLEEGTQKAEETKQKKPRHTFVKGYESKNLVDFSGQEYLIEGLLEVSAVLCLYGPSNVGKTFVMLDMALHVASGRPWNGRDTKKGAVVYVAAEGTRGIHKRIASWEKHHGVDMRDVWFSSRPSPIDLLSEDGDTDSFIKAVNEEATSWGDGVKPSLIVIDTLSRALAGGDENSSVDMGAFIKHIDKIKSATGAHIAIVHHSGKDVARGMRGWSGMRAAIDTEMEVGEGVLSVTKQRDCEVLEDQPFVLSDVILGTDLKGKTIKSAVAIYGAAAEMDGEGEIELTDREVDWFSILRDGVAAMAEETGRDFDGFKISAKAASVLFEQADAQAKGVEGRVKPLVRSTVLERMRALTKKGVLRKLDRNQWVIQMSR